MLPKPPTEEDFNAVDWRSVTPTEPLCNTTGLACAFEYAARAAVPESPEFRVYRFLQALCDPMFPEDGTGTEWRPMFVCGDRRSVVPADFSAEWLERVEFVAKEASQPLLRARAFDVLYCCGRDRLTSAEGAISSYTRAVEAGSEKGKVRALVREIERCAWLAGKFVGASETAQPVADASRVFFDLTHRLARSEGEEDDQAILWRVISHSSSKTIDASSLEDCLSRADSAIGTGTMEGAMLAANLYADAERIAKILRSADEARRATEGRAKAALVEAGFFEGAGPEGALNAAYHLENALHAMREAGSPKTDIEEIHHRLLLAQQLSVGQLSVVSTEVEIGSIRDPLVAALNESSDDQLLDLWLFCGRCVSSADANRYAQERLASPSFVDLFSRTVVSADGRPIARSAGTLPGSAEGEVEAKMRIAAEWARCHIQLRGAAMLAPGQTVLRERLSGMDLAQSIVLDGAVPPHLAESFRRVIVAGFEDDWLLVLRFLPLMFEEWLRYILRSRGNIVSNIRSGEGIQHLTLLGSLLEHEDLKLALGEDAVFELSLLLGSVEAHGIGIRNDVAHGIAPDDNAQSPPILTLWWHMLRLLRIVQLNAQKSESHSQVDQDEVGEEE